MQNKTTQWIVISGLLWAVIGAFLLTKGISLILFAAKYGGESSLMAFFAPLVGGAEQVGLFWIIIGLLIGYAKGKYVLSKSVNRVVNRIVSLPHPIRWYTVYARGYYLLISCMVLLGVLLRALPIPADLHGMIDLAIGSALINGSVLYFRFATGFRPST